MIRRYTITLDDRDVEPPVEVIATCLAGEMLQVISIEDVTVTEPDPTVPERFIGFAQIRLAGDVMYAACPMTAANLPLLSRWLMDNHAALCKEATHEPSD